MAVTHTLQANFTQSLGKAIVPPAGSKTMVFFGTSGDGNEGNRIVGGNALTVSSGAPVHASNYVSVGHQPPGTPTRFDVIDSGNGKDATSFAAGHTWMCCARVTSTGAEAANFSACMSNMTATSGQGVNMDVLTLQAGQNRVINYVGNGNRGLIQLTSAAAWHFLALTDTGGAAGTVQIWEFTENQAGQSSATPYTSSGRVANAAMTTHFGCLSVETSTSFGAVDIAWGFECSGVLSQANMAALATSARPWLARRGISA